MSISRHIPIWKEKTVIRNVDFCVTPLTDHSRVNHTRSVHFYLLVSPPEEGTDQQSVLQEATDLLHTKFGFYSITIQVELYSEDMSYCSHCQDPSDW